MSLHRSPFLRHRVLALFLAMAATGAGVLRGQEKAAFNPATAKPAQLGLPSPYDKFLGLDQVLNLSEAQWKGIYQDVARYVDASKIREESDAALALGVKIADGVMAIKARHLEGLNECSRQIEELAKKLGVSEQEMTRAKTVRAHANKDEWLRVFLELGFLQTDIMRSLRAQGGEVRRPLIIAAGWMQGLHYTSKLIVEHYSAENSNFLREPMLVKAMQEELQQLPDNVKNRPKTAALIRALQELHSILDIPLGGSVSLENVRRIVAISGDLVEKLKAGS